MSTEVVYVIGHWMFATGLVLMFVPIPAWLAWRWIKRLFSSDRSA